MFIWYYISIDTKQTAKGTIMSNIMTITPINSTNSFIAGEKLPASIKNITHVDTTASINIVDVSSDDGQQLKKVFKSVDIVGKVTLSYAAGYDFTFVTTLASQQELTADVDARFDLGSLKNFISNPKNNDLFSFDMYNALALVDGCDLFEVVAHTDAVMRFLQDNDMINYVYNSDGELENEVGYISQRVKIDAERNDWLLAETQQQLDCDTPDIDDLLLDVAVVRDIKSQLKDAALHSLHNPMSV